MTSNPADTDDAKASCVQHAAKPRVVVLGSGWASMSMIKALTKEVREKYDVIVVSPRNYFLYTPLLPAVAVGTMEERSIIEPVRNLVHGKAHYYEAFCKEIDPKAKEIVACFPDDGGNEADCFKIKYDMLIIGVGSVNNTFDIQGVAEHCQFFKSIEDANHLRRRISECFERAALPNTTEEERKQLLSFVVCGGGPTGVEVAAELHDMIFEDLKDYYPELMQDVHIRLIELMDHVLSTYDRKIGEYTAKQFHRTGIDLVLHTRVVSVAEDAVRVRDKASQEEYDIPFGSCIWATGIAMNPLVKQLQKLFPDSQTHFRCVLTDDFLQVKGSDGSIYALGDASTIHHEKALDYADQLFEEADADKDGMLTLSDLQKVLHKARQDFPHLEEHAKFLDAKCNRFGNLVQQVLHSKGHESALDGLTSNSKLTKEQFMAVLEKVDRGLRSLPATAQVAKQHGEYMAELLAAGHFCPDAGQLVLDNTQKPFAYFHKGSLAYIGNNNAVMDVPAVGPLMGQEVGVMWKGYETVAQISLRNSVLVFNDWVRTKVFGRDPSRV
eukprot:gene9271-9436_t